MIYFFKFLLCNVNQKFCSCFKDTIEKEAGFKDTIEEDIQTVTEYDSN